MEFNIIFFKTSRISIILLFIASTMLIGVFSGCATEAINEPETETTQIDYIETSSTSTTVEPNYKELLKIEPSQQGIQISDEEIREIVWAYLKDSEPNFEYTYSISCYGTYNNAYLFFIDCSGWGVYNVVTKEVINGLTFVYPTSRVLEVYFDGEIYSMSEAFEAGIINEEVVAVYHEFFN